MMRGLRRGRAALPAKEDSSPTGHAVMYGDSIRIELAGGASERAA